MAKETKAWDPAERLTTPEAIADYLDAALEDGDPKVIASVLGDIARAKGMAEVARSAGLSRESLYRALSDSGNPSLATALSVVRALGLSLAVRGTDHADAA
ncbi:addiction module antidote protein [Azospirillum sp. BE72]|uniref:addiction module antidote protein n=1 Tax=Azospirillum sp. BE72 TaxID=2817776 RepID=UPI002859408A|nr:addiction module antidote protein [Azospirillum sp. BE72]MDR6770371.1 putative addiction module antidote protein [Azospirillum sp. BE72]